MPQYHKSVLYTSDILIVKCKERPLSDKRLKGWPISDHPVPFTEHSEMLLKTNKMFLTPFLSSFQLQSQFKSYTKGILIIQSF